MKWKKFLFFIPLITLVGCKGNNEIATKCPLGAPSLLFYDQGNNFNFVTINGAAQIVAEFQQNKYDALVVDATSGLKQIKTHTDTLFRFAKLLTSGNLYLTSFLHDVSIDTPKSTETILSFGASNSVPYLVSNKLKETKWNNCTLNTVGDVALVLSAAKYDLENTPKNDYYVIAEPALNSLKTTAKSKTKNLTYIKLTDSSLLNSKIPQAALFINKNSYNKKKDKFKTYLNDLNTRITNCIDNPEIFKASLDKYGDDTQVSERFGFKSSVAYDIQLNNANGFAINPKDEKFTYTDMNNFMEVIGQKGDYTSEEFINVE